jgi:hypothetical protein
MRDLIRMLVQFLIGQPSAAERDRLVLRSIRSLRLKYLMNAKVGDDT